MILKKGIPVLTAALMLLLSCQEEKMLVQTEIPFAVEQVGIPPVLSNTTSRPVLITARIFHPQGKNGIRSVVLEMNDSQGQPVLSLEMRDDGGVEDPASGDVIAFDLVYSVTIIGNQLGLAEGTYQAGIRAQATDGEQKQSAPRLIDVFPNQPPEIMSVSFPDSLPSGFSATEALITVQDNDGLDDIRWVIIQGFEAGNVFPAFRDTVFNPYNNSPVFIFTLDSSYGAGRKGDYQLEFFAEDRVGDFSEEVSRDVFIGNSPPQLRWILVPDTMIIPPAGATVDTVRAAVFDRQSLNDIASVYFISRIRRNDGTLGPSSDPIELFDNGDLVGTGDRLAADGEFSRIIRLESTNTPGTYIFTFRTEDYADQMSDVMVDSIRVIRN